MFQINITSPCTGSPLKMTPEELLLCLWSEGMQKLKPVTQELKRRSENRVLWVSYMAAILQAITHQEFGRAVVPNIIR